MRQSAINQKKPLPFRIHVAYGIYVNDTQQPLPPDDGVKQADQNMYEMKKKLKEND